MMHTPETHPARKRRGFTLVELITAMAITAILVLIIMQLTNQSVTLWKVMQEDTSSSVTARMALQTLSRDLESFQVRSGSGTFQWLYAEVDEAMSGVPRGMNIPKSARCIFYVCAPDRNPSVSSGSSLRNTYRDIRANNIDTQGDVSAVGYRLMFRDQILNIPGKNGDVTTFPLFSLYRQVLSPRDTYDYMLGRDDLKASYARFEGNDDKHFLCENIVELSLIFNVEYPDVSSSTNNNQPTYRSLSVPILSTTARKGKSRFRLFGDRAFTDGEEMESAHIVSAELCITVLTEEGVALVEQVRLGQRRPPKLQDFFSRYTRSYTRAVSLPLPL